MEFGVVIGICDGRRSFFLNVLASFSLSLALPSDQIWCADGIIGWQGRAGCSSSFAIRNHSTPEEVYPCLNSKIYQEEAPPATVHREGRGEACFTQCSSKDIQMIRSYGRYIKLPCGTLNFHEDWKVSESVINISFYAECWLIHFPFTPELDWVLRAPCSRFSCGLRRISNGDDDKRI